MESIDSKVNKPLFTLATIQPSSFILLETGPLGQALSQCQAQVEAL